MKVLFVSLDQKVVPSRLTPLGPDSVTAGLDWARDDHAVAVVNASGETVERFSVDHLSRTGLAELVRRLRRAGAGEVAIERPDGQVVDALLAAGLTVVVISPNQVKNPSRSRLHRQRSTSRRRPESETWLF